MSDQTGVLLADLLATQKRVLAVQEELLVNSRLAIKRQQRALRWFPLFIVLLLLYPYIPWLIRVLFSR